MPGLTFLLVSLSTDNLQITAKAQKELHNRRFMSSSAVSLLQLLMFSRHVHCFKDYEQQISWRLVALLLITQTCTHGWQNIGALLGGALICCIQKCHWHAYHDKPDGGVADT